RRRQRRRRRRQRRQRRRRRRWRRARRWGCGRWLRFFLKSVWGWLGGGMWCSGFCGAVWWRAGPGSAAGALSAGTGAGQVTPGPVFTTATFIGYLLRGGPGALLATLGIFAPAFVFVALSAPIVPWLRRSRLAGAFLDGLNVASLALMAVVSWFLARAALH